MPCTDDVVGATATLYLIRHGRTCGNRRHYVGRQDLALDAVGHEQAARLAHALAGEALDALYSSTLARARQTAEALVLRGGTSEPRALPLCTRSELMEIDYGDFTGLPKTDVSLRLKRDYVTRRLPGGESLTDVHARVARFAQELAPRLRSRESVAVVGHYRSLQLLRGVLAGESLEQTLAGSGYKPANGSLLRLQLLPAPAPVRCPIVSATYTADFGVDASEAMAAN
jgi:broad specificity phosphatase PhoE